MAAAILLAGAASLNAQESAPLAPTPPAAFVSCLMMTGTGASPEARFPTPGTVLSLPSAPAAPAIRDRLVRDFGFIDVVMSGSASVELAAGTEQRCPGKPGGTHGVLQLIEAQEGIATVRLRLVAGDAVLSDTRLTLPLGQPVLIAAGGERERHFLLVGTRRRPVGPQVGPGGPSPPREGAPFVLRRTDPVLADGTPPIRGDLIVLLDVGIDPSGGPTKVHAVHGAPSLATAVEEAVRQWRFRAGLPDGFSTLVGLNLLSRGRAARDGSPDPQRTLSAPPVKIRDVKPRYPADAMKGRVRGTVMIEALIDAEGIVSDACVIRGPAELTQAALEAVMGWRYAPQPGRPPLRTVVTVSFDLY